MPAFVVRTGAGRGRRYLAAVDPGRIRPPLAWTEDAGRALTFPSSAEALAFGLAALGHSLFDVGPVPIRSTA